MEYRSGSAFASSARQARRVREKKPRGIRPGGCRSPSTSWRMGKIH